VAPLIGLLRPNGGIVLHFLFNRAVDVATFGMERSAAKQREAAAIQAAQEQRDKSDRVNRFIENERQAYAKSQGASKTHEDQAHGD